MNTSTTTSHAPASTAHPAAHAWRDARRRIRARWRRLRYRGSARYCPCCDSHLRRFQPRNGRADAQCPVCGSCERDRLMHLYLTRETDLFDGRAKKLLHIAPERQLIPLLSRPDHIDYVSADLDTSRAMVKMDVTDIQYPDDTFDVIYCSHVLEHVTEDRKAMAELHRVLKVGGWAILQVPITAERTFEDPTVTDPAERERLFGQHDHVRRYGPDYRDRLIEAGFDVAVTPYATQLGADQARQYGLGECNHIHQCRKPARE